MRKFNRKRNSNVRISSNDVTRKSTMYDRLGKRIYNTRDYVKNTIDENFWSEENGNSENRPNFKS